VERISIIRNPVDERLFTPEGEKAPRNTGGKTILFVGRLDARKGVHFLMQAVPKVLKECPDAHFICIGSDTAKGAGNASVLAELKKSLATDACGNAVTFIQHVPLDQLPAYYRSADICVLPSLYENAPMTAIEAMSCGKPVVASSAGGTKEYVIDNRCGLIVPSADSDALAHALIKLLKDDKLLERLGQGARNHVEEALTLDKFAADSLALYETTRQTFARRLSVPFYTGAPEMLHDDLRQLITAFEKRLYDMIFTYSLRFRLRHWQSKARQLFARKR
jgi:glycosyltransferase involved in cell wall biosynthesis